MDEARDPLGTVDIEEAKKFAASTSAISSAVENLISSPGWSVFMALYLRIKNEIKEKDDYESLEDFKADREALNIVEGIFATFRGYIQEAKDAAETLKELSTEQVPKDRGIMLVDAVEGDILEG